MTLRGLALWALVVAAAGCKRQDAPAQTTFYDRKIAPILEQSCAASPTKSGCHVAAEPPERDRGNALGNLDVSSYERLTLRRDLFLNYGPYGMPGLLLKVVPPTQLSLTSWEDTEPTIITTRVPHVGGSLIDLTTASFTQLQTWIENGAAKNNAAQLAPEPELLPCSEVLGNDAAFDPTNDPATSGAADYAAFRSVVNSILGRRCAASNCHGSPANSLHLTCGTTTEQERWNYFAASDYVSVDPAASEILRRTLAPSSGGTFHEGGAIFSSQSDSEYQAILNWVTQKGGPTNVPSEAGFSFFASRVQPMLVKRGCMMLGCHSAAMFHDYRLRGGSGGHFGLPATRKNYELSLEQLALEHPDPTASRLVRKNLPPGGGGMLHRGGPLFAGRPETCDLEAAESGPLDEQNEYCVIAAWFAAERAARMATLPALSGIAFVRRPPAPLPDRPQDYASYAPGAEVVLVGAELGPSGEITLSGETSLSALCGLDPATTDARRPAVSWDGARIAFSARTGQDQPLRIYVVEGGACAVEPGIDASPVDDLGRQVPSNGELIHNFDPAFSPDGRIVFSSTRGNVTNVAAFSYQGPQRSPADPSRLNANLYVLEGGAVRQLTFLLNQELSPSFMRDGRVILITEKRAPGFYQLAGRRINLDGGDYHPLFGQRGTIGYTQFTDVVELADKNLAAILSEQGAAHGAGALAIVNRSIGVDQPSRVPEDYTQDPSAMDWPNPDFLQHSLSIINPEASGRLAGTQGAYRNPSPLPDGRLLVSYAANVIDLGNFAGNFDLYVVDPETGMQTALTSGADDELWPVAVYGKYPLPVFRSRLDEANGATEVVTGSGSERAQVNFMDVGVFMSLLFQNTRTRRILPPVPNLTVWESLPPEPGVTSFAGGGAFVTSDQYGDVYVRRQLLGGVETFSDGSGAMTLRGGVPIVLRGLVQLAGDQGPVQHFQREEMQFYPGERVRQSFRRDFFNGLCGGCHGAISGYERELAVNPDILTQASAVMARGAPGSDLTGAPQGGISGPEAP
jgi:hypothetical protein